MLELKVLYIERNGDVGICRGRKLPHKHPRNYMCGWSFERMMKYAKEELYWNDIDEQDVRCFIIINQKEQWYQTIRKGDNVQ